MIKELIIRDVAQPLVRRVGTMVSAALIGAGVATDTTNTIVAGLVAVCGVGIDLTLARISRR